MNTIKIIKNKKIAGSRDRATLLDCYYLDNQAKKPVIIFCHGFKGYKDWGCFNLMAEQFAEAGFVFIKFNFSYNGGTLEDPIDFPDLEAFSENNYSTELNDLGMVLDLLWEGNIAPKDEFDLNRVYLIGHSRGGGIVVLKTAEDNRIAKTVTLASVSDFGYFFHLDDEKFKQFQEEGVIYIENSRTHQMMPIKYQFYEDYENNHDRLDIQKNAQKIKQEVLIIHGTKDSSVNIKSADDLNKSIKNSFLYLIEGADHVFGAYQPYDKKTLPFHFQEWMNRAIDFFEQEHSYGE